MKCDFCSQEKIKGVVKQNSDEPKFICDTCTIKASNLIKNPIFAPFRFIFIQSAEGENNA